MKTLITLIAILVGMMPLEAGAKCKFSIKESNHVATGLVKLRSKAIQGVLLVLGNREGNFYIEGRHSSLGNRLEFDAETPWVLTLENGELLSLTPVEPERAERVFHVSFAKVAMPVFESDRPTFETLRTTAIVSAAMHYKHEGVAGVEEFDVGTKNAKGVMEHAGCVLDRELT